jgi:hypothetical protein
MNSYGPNEFRAVAPGAGKILLFYDTDLMPGGQAVIVEQINISTTDCAGNNRATAVSNLTSITIGSNTFILQNPTAYSSHYNFDIGGKPQAPRSTYYNDANDGSCIDVDFVPTPFIEFTYNDYNATLGNAQELRRSNFYYEVDSERSGSSSRPQNIINILNETAVTASVQESNYTSLSITQGRYEGTITDEDEYGIPAALTGKVFRGALFDNTADLGFIISSSQNGTVQYRELLQVVDSNYSLAVGNNSLYHVRGSKTLETPNARYINVRYSSFTLINMPTYTLPTLSNSGSLMVTGSMAYHDLATYGGSDTNVRAMQDFGGFKPGEPIMHGRGNISGYSNPAYEFVTFKSSSFDSGNTLSRTFETTLFFQTGSRNYPETKIGYDVFEDYNTRNSDNSMDVGRRTWTQDPTNVYKVIGDSIYESSNNQISKVGNKLLLVESTQEIMYIDENGKILFNMGNQLT